MNVKNFSAFFDRIEDSRAVLLLGEEEEYADIPIKYLPDSVRPGSVLLINISEDPDATAALDSEIRRMIAELGEQ